MSAVNPYAPPTAAVADVREYDGATQPVRTWSSQGRVGRLRYLAHITGAYLLALGVTFGVSFVLGFVGFGKAATAIGAIGMLVYFWFLILKSIQRSHDMNWSGWTSLLALIPLVGLVWIFKAGSEGANRFGGPSPANTTGVKILGLAIPVIGLIGVVAAVLLPMLARR